MKESFVKKACMIDISRFRVPTFARMKKMFDNLATYGFNQVFFNIEHVYKIAKHPRIGAESDGFTEKEFKELDDYAFSLGLELTPIFQSFGHMFHILKWQEYEHLSESEKKWSVAMLPETYELLDDFYESISRTFRSKYIHVGGDEVYDMLTGKSKHLLDSGKTANEIFLDHILKLKELAHKYDKEVFIWGDMIERDPDVLDKLGTAVNICYWNYDFKKMPDHYRKLQNKIYVCPGTNTWKSFFPRIKYAAKNFKMRAEDYNQLEAFGYMLTDWGDGGQVHPISYSEKMFELGFKVFAGNKVEQIITENKTLDKIINLLDKIHYCDGLPAKRFREHTEFLTRNMFHDYIFSGESFANLSNEQLESILADIEKVRVLDNECQYSGEFENDMKLFVEQTFVFAEKIRIHLGFRCNEDKASLALRCEDYLISLRKWFAEFMRRWLHTCQPMGLYFHIHYMKQLEVEIIEEMKMLQSLDDNYKYADIKKKNIYDEDEKLSLCSVGLPNALNSLWDKYRL